MGKKIFFKKYSLLPFDLHTFGRYVPIIAGLRSSFLANYDVVINTSGNYSPIFFRSFIKKYFFYIYNPKPFFYASEKYDRNLLWHLYLIPEQIAVKKSMSCINGQELIAVSNFTKWRIKKFWGKDSTTIYPPVDCEKFRTSNLKRNGIITIGRFSSGKNHAMQITLAKYFPELTFRICGSANEPESQLILKELKKMSENMELKNVEFFPNISFNKLIGLISESKFFLHTTFNEDFGLTTCETIIGGCVPLVHNSGGSVEIVPYRELRFNDLYEAKERLKMLLKTDTYRFQNKLQTHIMNNYSEGIFKNRIISKIFK